MRLSTTSSWETDATDSCTERSSPTGLGRYSGVVAARRCSKRVVLPAPLCPTRTTLRMLPGSLACGAGVLAGVLALMATRSRLMSVRTTPARWSVLCAHHAEPIRARVHHQTPHATGHVVPAAGHPP